MAFTFQINSGVRFNRNEDFLQKAKNLTPPLFTKIVRPVRLVNLVRDEAKQGGFRAEDRNLSAAELGKLKMKRGESVILDFGEHCTGYFSVNAASVGSHQDSPLSIFVQFAEIPAELETKSADYDGWLSKSWIQEELLHVDTLPARLEFPRRYSFRYAKITVIDTSPKWQVVFSEPEVKAKTSADYSRLPQKFAKTKIDSELQKICDVSVKTLSECMQLVFEDGPKRDRRLWLGDLRLQALANYETFASKDLVKRCLYLFAAVSAEDGRMPADVFTAGEIEADDTFLFDYTLFFPCALFDYIEHFSDDEALFDLYPAAKNAVDSSLKYLDSAGKLILDESYPAFIDWSSSFDKTSAAQGVLIYALNRFVQLAKKAGDKDAEKYSVIAEKAKKYARENLFDKEKNLFVSGENREISIASQVWLVLADVFSAEENERVMKNAIAMLFPVRQIATPYMYHHIAEALFHAGLKSEGVALIKNYWGAMIRRGADTFWEAFEIENAEYSPYGSPAVNSYCHAWSCTSVYLVNKYL